VERVRGAIQRRLSCPTVPCSRNFTLSTSHALSAVVTSSRWCWSVGCMCVCRYETSCMLNRSQSSESIAGLGFFSQKMTSSRQPSGSPSPFWPMSRTCLQSARQTFRASPLQVEAGPWLMPVEVRYACVGKRPCWTSMSDTRCVSKSVDFHRRSDTGVLVWAYLGVMSNTLCDSIYSHCRSAHRQRPKKKLQWSSIEWYISGKQECSRHVSHMCSAYTTLLENYLHVYLHHRPQVSPYLACIGFVGPIPGVLVKCLVGGPIPVCQ
jgi:hypothetical protein